ncbi:MAG TPA: sodium:solute symporter family protein [Opitutales bacterium]|nr:sodium:solute symporter family protein [Opitutales bacterium]
MEFLDYIVLGLFFLLLIGIGVASFRKVSSSDDFFVGGGQVPWWLAGVSHHVSGYSGVVFVAYAGIAYTLGFTIYIWWALPVAIACLSGAFIFAPRWSRLREGLNIQSPTEYLATRYDVPAQQLIAWSGVGLKLFDVGAKWAAMGILLNGFTGLPVATGILVSGGVSLLYITIGGLWADLYNDFAQFGVQVLAGIVLLVEVMKHFGGVGGAMEIWKQLPEGHSAPFAGIYTPGFVLAFLTVAFLSYNGGTWNLATRYISAPSGRSAQKSALLSGALSAIWPLFLFLPMWAAPLMVPGLENPETSYIELVNTYLPAGLVGLVLASMFAGTMSMTTSDANTVSAVITRDILPLTSQRFKNLSQRKALWIARVATFVFTVLTLILAINSHVFGGVLPLIVMWFGALVGPVAVPMLFGLLPVFRHANATVAIASIVVGLVVFSLTKEIGELKAVIEVSAAVQLGAPVFCSILVFSLGASMLRGRPVRPEVEQLFKALSKPEKAEALMKLSK